MALKILSCLIHHTEFGVTMYNNRDELSFALQDAGSATTIEDLEAGKEPLVHGILTEEAIELNVNELTGEVNLVRAHEAREFEPGEEVCDPEK
jgi:hypothetical protein